MATIKTHSNEDFLGVCYYPEHWYKSVWEDDAKLMKAVGISWVRIGEFAWSRIEPEEGKICLDWLRKTVDLLHANNLKVIFGTPTAIPPKWLIDKHPSVLARDESGNLRKFGSRRHYCFSSRIYRRECLRILTVAFAEHPAICLRQTDNEYGRHNITISYSTNALEGFQKWTEKNMAPSLL